MLPRTIENTILDYSMKVTPEVELSDARIHGFKSVNINVVNTRFEVELNLPNISRNKWKKTYADVNDLFKSRGGNRTRFIIVTDGATDNTVLYINKIK